MFTGIIEEIGEIKAVQNGRQSARLTIKGNVVTKDSKVGDSIAVNGVCLTATSIEGNMFTADVMAETMRRTALSKLVSGSRVNLERAMAADGRFGGHIVSGHIDGTGTIRSMKREDNAVWVEIAAEEKILRYIIEKGSIAINGISLTVAYVDDTCFRVSIIPHTGEATTLLEEKPGNTVNLENDVIGKYVEKLLRPTDNMNKKEKLSSGMNMNFLAEHGFL